MTSMSEVTNVAISDPNGYNLLVIASRIADNVQLSAVDDEDGDQVDCFDPKKMVLKKFLVNFKKYMYPASIEFSITMGTLFIIFWYKIGKKFKEFSLLPTKKRWVHLIMLYHNTLKCYTIRIVLLYTLIQLLI
jgi:hypothetical protein